MKIFLTGDRSADPVTSIAMAIAGLNRAREQWSSLGDAEYVTGDRAQGVEPAFKYLLRGAGLEPSVVDAGKASTPEELDSYHTALKSWVDAVVVVHTAPFESKIAASVLRVWGDDDERVLLVTS